MKVCVLGSGSKGNTTYVESNNSRLLIDLGNTCKYVTNKLKEINVDASSLDGILISHTHKDHVGGLEVFLKKNDIPVYLTKGMLKELSFIKNYVLIDDDDFCVGDIKIETIKTSHDAVDSRGFILYDDHSSMVQITDTGYINQKYYKKLENKNLYIIESNHDIEMLTNGPYPSHLKQRIYSDKGHLSNYDASRYISMFVGENTDYVLLAHLSEKNNTSDLAYNELITRLEDDNKHVNNIIVTSQNNITEFIEI